MLYLYGGVQTLSAQGVSAPDSVLSGLQAFTLPTAPATSTLAFAPAAAAAATAAWGAVRPGWVSGAATWADLSNAAAPQVGRGLGGECMLVRRGSLVGRGRRRRGGYVVR